MSLEDRIIERWQAWWHKNIALPPNLTKDTMRSLINIALEEVQAMDETLGSDYPKLDLGASKFTTSEAIHIHSALSMLKILTMPKFPLPDSERLSIAKDLVTPEIVSALLKIESHLSGLQQVRETLAGIEAPDREVQ